MYKLVGPEGETELTENEMRRMLSLSMEGLSLKQRGAGLNDTECRIREAIQGFRRLNSTLIYAIESFSAR
jgi:hypothetical protein